MKCFVSLSASLLTAVAVHLTTLHAANVDVFYTDFESGLPVGFTPAPLTSRVGTEGYASYGFGNYMLISQGGTNTGNAVALTLTGLPAHTSVELDFLLAIINSWDGWEGAPNGHDLFNVEVDGVSVSRNHFSNLWLGNMVNPPPGTSIVFQTNDVAFAGIENAVITHWPDSAYRMTLRTLPHTASTMTIRWYADGGGWQGGSIPTDEFWGIDNLRVRLNNVGQMAPRIVTQPPSSIVTSGGIAAFNVSVSAIPAPQFAWYREGSATVLGVGAGFSFGPVGAGDVGGYYVVINNTLGSVTSAVAQLALTDNQPPLKNSPLPDHTITYGAAFNFAVPADTFVEPDAGQTLVWSVNGLPSGLFFNSVTRTFSGVPMAGVHLITVTATDNGAPPLSTSDTFRLMVTGSPLYEGFDYPAGTAILTRNGGTGWAGPWYNGTYSNAAPSISYPGIPATGGRAVALPNSVQARRPIHPSVFAPPAPGALPTKYFSALMRADGALNGWCAIDLVGTAGRALSVGKPFSGQTGMYVLETGPQQTASTHAVVTGSNVLLVVKCEFFNGNDRFTLYINPVPGEPPPVPAVVKFDHDVGTTFTNLMISSSIACSIDELRIGDSFAEVLPALCPPTFLAQPTNQAVAIGLPLILNALAAGQGTLAYQWRKDGVPLLNNGPITGADTATLVIPTATAADSGAYDVVVTSPCDTLTSQVAAVVVQGLAFAAQPLSQAVRPGSNATFSVTVSSASPVTYQWQFNGVNIENATSPTLTVLSAQVAQRGNYRCVAHNSLGDFTSADARLEVIVAPTFVEHPQSLTVAVGADASFSAAVTNTASVPITFTLRKGSTSLVNPPPQTLMSTSCTFTLMNVQLTDAGSYRIVATNIAGQLLGSSAATLTVVNSTSTSYVWTGGVNEDWWNPGNWLPIGVPGTNDDATIRSGSVTMSGNVSARTLNFSGAFLSGSATFHGTLNWTNGWLTGDYLLNLAAGSTLNVLPGAMKVMQSNFKIANAGTIHWDAPWAFESGAISNLAGGQIIITTPTPADPAVGGLVPIYHQAGALLRVTTSMSFSTALRLYKSGDVEITGGTLTLVRPLASSGRWSLPAGTGLRVQGDAAFAAGTLFDGPGLVTLTGGGTVTFAGDIHAPNLALDGAFVIGNWSLDGTLNWTSGWLTDDYLLNLAAGSALNVLPGSSKVIQRNFKIANAGTIHWDAPWAFDSGAISNLADGQIIITTPTPADPAVGGLVPIYHEAGALLRVTTSMSFSTALRLYKTGDVEITSGTLTLVRPLASSGRWSLPGGTGLRVQGDAAFTDGTLFDGSGLVTLTGGGTVTFAGDIHAPNLALDGAFVVGNWTLDGTLNWTSGWLTDDYRLNLAAGSTLNLLPGAIKVIQRNFKLANAGTIHWDAPWAFDSGAISNLAGGQIIITTSTPADLSVGGTVPLYNQAGAVLSLTNVSSTVNWYSGLPLHNQGALEIWQGILSLPGNYAPGATSSLKIGLGGATPGTGFGQLAVAGTATLAGQIQAEVTGGFRPNLNDEFTILTCASRSGTFANADLVAGSRVLTPDHRPTSVALIVTSLIQSLAISPTTTNAAPGDSITFTATNGTAPYTFTLVTNNSGGDITTSGLYTAGNLPGVDTVRVTDALGSNATATVTVNGCASLAGQIAWWRGENDALDSALTNHGALVNGIAFAPGRVGQAFSLDGVNDFVRVAPPGTFSPTGSMTLQAWIKPSALDQAKNYAIVSKANYHLAQTWWHLSLSTNRLHFHLSRNGINSGAKSVASAPGLVLPDVWTHVAATWDAPEETIRLFINGQEVAATPVFDTQINHLYESPIPVLIGALVGGAAQPTNLFAGLIDEVEVFSRAVPPAEIAFAVNGSRCAPTPCAPPPGGLIALWRGEENGLDSASTNHGTLQSGAQFASGVAGHAFSLDGVDDYVRVAPPGTLSPTGSMTLQAWIKPAAIGAEQIQTIVSKANANLARVSWHFSVATNRLYLFLSRNGISDGARSVVSAPGLLAPGVWTHVAATWDLPAETMRLFVNGEEVAAFPVITTQINHLYASPEPVRIGAQVGDSGNIAHLFNGLLDEVALHDRALSAAEIFAVARGCTAPPLMLTPANTSVPTGDTVQFTATGGTPPYAFAFDANNSGGSLTADGAYVAGTGCVADAVRVTDAAGSNALASVTILDTVPPVIACPADITIEAASPGGSEVRYLVTATDNCTARPALVTSPPSGGTFPIGTNDVTCQAVDGAGNHSVCVFKVIVRDTTPPSIVCPANVSVSTVNPAGTTVDFTVTAGDVADANVLVEATPPTGTQFPPGSTTVNCLATGAAGNTSSCSFTVTVTVVPTTFAVSGRVALGDNTPVAGVAVSLTGGSVNTSALTDAGGNYLFSSVSPGSYTVRLAHPNFAITPASANVTVAGANVALDFTAVRTGITLSGRVTNCVTGAGVAGVRVYATGVRARAMTDSDGYYSLPTVPLAAEIQVDAMKRDARTEPGVITLSAPTGDVTANFCIRPQVRVEGVVQDAEGVGLDGCPVNVGGAVSTTVSTRAGRFLLRHYQGEYLTVTPGLEGFLFDPLSLILPELMSDVSTTFVGTELPGLEVRGRIAFDNSPGPRSQTMVVGDDGSSFPVALGPLGSSGSPDLHHAWTRDGSKVAFERGGFICVINADGSGFAPLVNLSATVNHPLWPAWSPDGLRLLCTDSSGGLWLVNANGSGATRRVGSRVSGGASWSPDGTEVAYPSGNQIVRIKANSQPGDPPPVILSTAFGSLASVAWSPNGGEFACRPWDAVNGPAPCFIVRTNGGSPTLVLPDADSLALSPDGSRIAFTRSARLFSVRTNGTDLRQISRDNIPRIGAHSWAPISSFAASTGANQTAGNPEATTVMFANVTNPGQVTFTPLAPDALTLPPGYFSFGGESAVQIETTAQFSGPITVCFKVPDSVTLANFARLRIFHGENGVLVDRTILPPDSPAPDYATRTICARVTSLSPFVLAERIDTALPQISGVVVGTNGLPLVDAFVALSGDTANQVSTDLDGQFAFPNLSATGNYTVSVAKPGVGFNSSTMTLTTLGVGADVLFVGTNAPPAPVPSLAIVPDPAFGNQPTIAWPGFPEEFVLEATDSLINPRWTVTPELQIGTTNGVAVPLPPAQAERYYRLRR